MPFIFKRSPHTNKFVQGCIRIKKGTTFVVPFPLNVCGETGIRTLEPRKRLTVFETAPIDHSGISPRVLRLQSYNIFFLCATLYRDFSQEIWRNLSFNENEVDIYFEIRRQFITFVVINYYTNENFQF